jgi:YggT family protein
MPELFGFLRYVVDLYMWIVIFAVILSLLISFNVINAYNPFVRSLSEVFRAVTEPLLRPIRRALPNMGQIDISPMVLIIALVGIRDFLLPFLIRMTVGA